MSPHRGQAPGDTRGFQPESRVCNTPVMWPKISPPTPIQTLLFCIPFFFTAGKTDSGHTCKLYQRVFRRGTSPQSPQRPPASFLFLLPAVFLVQTSTFVYFSFPLIETASYHPSLLFCSPSDSLITICPRFLPIKNLLWPFNVCIVFPPGARLPSP